MNDAFLTALKTGECGVKLVPPSDWETVQHGVNACVFADRARGVVISVSLMPYRVLCEPRDADVLRKDFERSTRVEFIRSYQPPEEGVAAFGNQRPRTDDPSWSPLIECGVVKVGHANCAKAIHRVTYQPGQELLSGKLQIPVETGTVEMSLMAAADATGYRESALMLGMGGVPTGEDFEFPPQSHYDDPAHDAAFPDHPLSRIRLVMAVLLDNDNVLSTVGHAVPESGADVHLAEAQSTVSLPPRYARMPPGALRLAETMATFTRTGHNLHEQPVLGEVFLMAGKALDPKRPHLLEALAHETARGWADEGATDVEAETRVLASDPEGRPVLACDVSFKVSGEPAMSLQIWTVTQDKRVFRLGISVPAWMPLEDAREDLAVLHGSWRPDPKPKSWWPFR